MAGAPTHETAVRNAISDTVLAQVDAGTGAAYLAFELANDTEVARITFPDPAGTVGATDITFDCDPDISDTSPTGSASPIAQASIFDSDDTKIMECTVGSTGTANGITISSVTVGSTDTVTLTDLTYAPPT